jgi:hypothetical protein
MRHNQMYQGTESVAEETREADRACS